MNKNLGIIIFFLFSIQISKADSIEYIKYSFYEIDTSCIKNPGIDYEKQNRNIFTHHLEFVIQKFSNTKTLIISNLLAYEDSIKAKNVSLGYKYGLDTAYYPMYDKFKFEKPYRFQRIECPIFDAYTEYFVTKKKKMVKVVSYNWYGHLPVIENEIFSNNSNSTLQRPAFETKYFYIEQTLNSLLGNAIQSIINSDGQRISVWKTKENINARLSMFGNYNEIRLFLYKD